MRLSTFLLCIVFLIAGIAVTALNSEYVDFNYYINTARVPLSILIIGMLILGVIAGFIIIGGSILKLKWENRGLKKKLNLLQEELSKLRVLDTTTTIKE